MKTIKRLGIAIMIALAFVACKSQQNTTNNNSNNNNRGNNGFVAIELPCGDESFDDDDYLKALGVGTHINLQSARSAAFDAAQSMIQKRLGGFVQGISTDYSRTVAGQAAADKVQRMMEGEMDKIVEKMVNDAQKTCEKFGQLQSGEYQSYIAIKIPKKEMVKQMENILSENEELEIEFNRDQFRKFADKRMSELKEAQKESGN